MTGSTCVTRENVFKSLELSFVLIVSSALFLYGIGKWVQFDGAANVDKSVAELTGMELMWAFYGYSKSFALILGAFEIVGGILLLFTRTRIIGCLFVTSILVNIIVQDIVYGVILGALLAAIIYQSLTLLILWFNRKPLVEGIKAITAGNRPRPALRQSLIVLTMAVSFAAVLKIVEFKITH